MNNQAGSQSDGRDGGGRRSPLAVIGIGCRFPGGGDTPAKFWDLLAVGADTLGPVPPERWNVGRFLDGDADLPGTAINFEGGFLSDPIDRFDADFFGISPREAACLDPQQRLLLEVAWEALEDAGIPADGLAGTRTGVYVGGFTTDSLLHQLGEANRDHISPQTATSATLGMLANRLSFQFDFMGPSITVDTACSSSLVALNYACRDLWQGECPLALAAGVNIMFRPEYSIAMTKGGFLAADSRSKAFDSRADGYARGEGAGVVVLKPLDRALADGDRVYALVRGTGVNQDGRTTGITVPNRDSQESLIRHVYADCAVTPADIAYVEAHGTGTAVGDPIESNAIGTVIGRGRDGAGPCLIGSVKANIGHLEAAAGIAGTIKSALILHHGQVPPQIQVRELNPAIPFSELNLRVPLELEPLPGAGQGPCISINSFGFGGANAHAVLQEAPAPTSISASAAEDDPAPATQGPLVLPLSARSPGALAALAGAYAEILAGDGAERFPQICRAAALRRAHHRHCAALVAETAAEAAEALKALAAGDPAPAGLCQDIAPAEGAPKPVFVFTGMGPQWWAMGRGLYETEPVYRQAVEEADATFTVHAGWSILKEMLAEQSASRMAVNEIAQPANFVLQVGLLALWRSWGVTPAAIIGHSVGEVAAAYAAGALTLNQAVFVSFHRSQCQQTLAGQGTMLAIGLDPETAENLVGLYPGRVSLASVNSPSSTALAGDRAALEEIAESLEEEGVINRFLRVDVAYHSHQMDPLEPMVMNRLAGLSPKEPAVALYSTVTGGRVAGPIHDAAYWWRNVRRPVRFRDALAAAARDGFKLFLEVGPNPVLAPAIKETAARESLRTRVLCTLNLKEDDRRTIRSALAELYCLGVAVDWRGLYGARCSHEALPLYPWQRERHWVESDRARRDRLGDGGDPLLGDRAEGPEDAWQSAPTRAQAGYLWDHKVDGMVVFPGAAYAQMMLAAQRDAMPETAGVIEDIRFRNALVLAASDKPVLRTQASAPGRRVAIHARRAGDEGAWQLCAESEMSRAGPHPGAALVDLDDLARRLNEAVEPEALYRNLASRGLEYGRAFRCIRGLRRRGAEVLVDLALDPSVPLADNFGLIHPTLLDASFQALTAAVNDGAAGGPGQDTVFVPVAIGRLSLCGPVGRAAKCYGRVIHRSAQAIEGEIDIFNAAGSLLVRVEGFRCQAVPRAGAERRGDRLSRWFYRYEWQPAPVHRLPDTAPPPGAWIIVSDDTRFGDDVVACLNVAGIKHVRVYHGAVFGKETENSFLMPLNDPESWSSLFDAISDVPIGGIAYLGGIENSLGDDDPTGIATCVTALRLVQELATHEAETLLRLFIVTLGVHAPAPSENVPLQACGQFALWGLGRVIMNEHPDLHCALVDFEPDYDAAAIEDLVAEFLAGDAEDEVALRGGGRFVHRLVRQEVAPESGDETSVRPATDPFRLDVQQVGDLASARFIECPRRDPGEGEVELRILGVSLNFKDILKMIGALSADITDGTYFGSNVGMEAAAEVVALGPGVTQHAVGDRLVVTLPGGCVRSYATTRLDAIHAVPGLPGHDLLDLAGVPIAFVTAYYGLHHVARLGLGERVLLHSASGGVGLAAIQVAQWLGAEVIATAGSEAKRDHLRRLGVAHVFDSRSLRFVDDVRAVTGGRGVDAVLNFLPGEAQDKSLGLLAPFGRFIEIGKRDIDENRGLGLRPFNRNLTFASIDIDRMLAEKRDLFARVLGEVWDGLRDGRFRPVEATTFAIGDFLDACKLMQRAEQIGKVLLRLEGESLPILRRAADRPLFRGQATYLVTGGFGGFGLKVAEWMVAEGARHMVMVGRSGATTAEAREALARMAEGGAEVLAAAADVSDAEAMEGVMARIAREMPPLAGVFHAAAVLDDAVLARLNPDRFARVMKAKAEGAWLLHRLTEGMELEYFVLFSSVAALVGNPGQGNYSAANTFLDCLAEYRAARGLTATSINWGALAEVGMAARDSSVAAWLNRVGVQGMPPALAIEAMVRVLRLKPAHIGVMDVDWDRWRQTNSAAVGSPKFAGLFESAAGGGGAATGLVEELVPLDADGRRQHLTQTLAEDVAKVLRLPVDRLDMSRPLTDMGVDSLLMVEVQLAVERRVGLEVTVMELSRGYSVAQLAAHLLDRLAAAAPSAKGTATPVVAAADRVDEMSDAEVAAMLDRLIA